MKILVIGGTKFFGIHMVNELLSKGHNVTIARPLRHKRRGFFSRMAYVPKSCFFWKCVIILTMRHQVFWHTYGK